jgi:cadmium resistance protein CadD (predicted permease)
VTLFYLCFLASLISLVKFILVMTNIAPVDQVTSSLSYLTLAFTFGALGIYFLKDSIEK